MSWKTFRLATQVRRGGNSSSRLVGFASNYSFSQATASTASTRPISTQPKWPNKHKYDFSELSRILAIAAPFLASVFIYERLQRPIRLDSSDSTDSFQPNTPPPPPPTPQSHVSSGFNIQTSNFIDASHLLTEEAILTTAPNVPPPITRTHPVLLKVHLTTHAKLQNITSQYKYETWTFNDTVPGPFIRAREGDVLELSLTNHDITGNPHNSDCHAFLGPGGGSALTTAEEGQTKTGRFRLLTPGLYMYHCAAAPAPVHIANGMYGLMYVQPASGDLPPVDREYYVMQSEFYHEPPETDEDGRLSTEVEFSYPNALREEPNAVLFNGRDSALTRDKPLKARVGESVRIFFGNAGPNLTSSFHVIGSNFMKLYRDGDILSPPARFVQTTSVPPGGATVVDMQMFVPGTYTIVDHALFRLDKGAVGYLNVAGEAKPEIYGSAEPPEPCVGCKLHP